MQKLKSSDKVFKTKSSSRQVLGIEEQSNEDGLDISNRLGEFVEYVRVQDKAFAGSMTNLVRIRDPCTG